MMNGLVRVVFRSSSAGNLESILEDSNDREGRFDVAERIPLDEHHVRLGIESSVTFVSKDSASSEAAIRKLASEPGSGANEKSRAIVFDGATAEEVNDLRQRLPDDVIAVPGNAASGQAVAQPLQGDPAEWRHIVFTYQILPTVGPTVTMQVRLAKSAGPFKDGPHSCAYESVTTAKSSTLRFGAGNGMGQAPGNFFSGQIDNVAFYNAVRSQGDIDKHFNLF